MTKTPGGAKFPVDVHNKKAIKTLEYLGFELVRKGNHLSFIKINNGTVTKLTLPNHTRIKGSTLRSACTQAGINREDFLKAYYS